MANNWLSCCSSKSLCCVNHAPISVVHCVNVCWLCWCCALSCSSSFLCCSKLCRACSKFCFSCWYWCCSCWRCWSCWCNHSLALSSVEPAMARMSWLASSLFCWPFFAISCNCWFSSVCCVLKALRFDINKLSCCVLCCCCLPSPSAWSSCCRRCFKRCTICFDCTNGCSSQSVFSCESRQSTICWICCCNCCTVSSW